MKTIKFRGLAYAEIGNKKINPSKLVYGNLLVNPDGNYPLISGFCDEHGKTRTYWVTPDTVAQFVGYDKDGKEIYSDDAIYSFARGNYFKAENLFRICDIGETFLTVELVEKDSKNET